MDEPEQNGVRDIAELLGKVFAAFFAVAYASGYLIFSDHLEELGIRDSGVNIIRAKYVWLGFLYLLPFLSLSAFTALLWMQPPQWFQKLIWKWPRRERRPSDQKYTNKYSQIVLVTTVLLSFRMMFFDAQWREDSSWLMFVTVIALLAYQVVHRVELFQKAHLRSLGSTSEKHMESHGYEPPSDKDYVERCIERSYDFKDAFRWLSFSAFAGTLYFVAARTINIRLLPYPSSEWFEGGSHTFIFLTFVCTVIALHTQAMNAFYRDSDSGQSVMEETDPTDRVARRRARWVVRTVIMLALFVASIHGFTHVVYPHIPVERGGGRYSGGTVVEACVRPFPNKLGISFEPSSGLTAQPDGFCVSGVSINDVVVVEEDPDTLYVASIYDQGIHSHEAANQAAPSCGVQNWHEGINSPRVLSLSKAAMVGVRDIDTVEKFCKSLEHPANAPAIPQIGR